MVLGSKTIKNQNMGLQNEDVPSKPSLISWLKTLICHLKALATRWRIAIIGDKELTKFKQAQCDDENGFIPES